MLFVETGFFFGTHLWHLRRGGRRSSLARRLFASEQVADGITVRKALNVLPWGQRQRLANTVNATVTSAVIRRMVQQLPGPVVLWTYDPAAARCIGECGEALAVYDCVDDYVEQAGSDPRRRALIAHGDRLAAERSRLVFATTSPLLERHRTLNPNTHLVPNVADYAHFAPAAEAEFAGDAVEGLPGGPILGFAGNFSGPKVDLDQLEVVARSRPDWTLLLIGPANGDAEGRVARLAELENVVWLGPKPYEELPRYVAAFDVGLIPYQRNAYTRSCFPLKLYEYLAAGKPVVASGLPELAGMQPDVLLTDGDPRAVIAATEDALAHRGEEERRRRMALAAANTWETRAGHLLDLVSAELEGDR